MRKLFKGVFFSLFYLVFFAFVVFALCEAGYRIYAGSADRVGFDSVTAVTEARHVAKPYVMFTAKPGAEFEGSTVNPLGYLGPLPTKEKQKDEFRIFFIGGSAVFQGAPPFPKLLESRFAKSGLSQVKVFNFAIVSSVSRQELVRILLDIGSYQPDLIISFTGYNDLYDTGWDPRINYPHRYILYEANPAVTLEVSDFRLLPILALGSRVFRDFFADKIYRSLTANILHSEDYLRRRKRKIISSAFVQNLRLSNQLSTLFGARYLSFLQPTIYFKKSYGPAEREFLSKIDPYFVHEAGPIRESTILEAARFRREMEFTDLSAFFQNEKMDRFSDWCHFHDQSALIQLSDYFFNRLSPLVNSPRRPKPVINGLIPEESFL